MRGCIIASIAYVLAIINADTALPASMICGSARCLAWKMIISRFWGASEDGECPPVPTEVALKMNAGMEEERSNTTKNVIREAKQYIQDNFQDPDLSVEKICRHLHMSPAYFSTMFKKETGQAYIAYRPMSGWGARSSF